MGTLLVTHDEDQLRELAEDARELGARVRLSGYWLWAQFETKPEQTAIDKLKAQGWVWCSTKKMWAFRGAIAPKKRGEQMGWHYVANKYGIQTLDDSEGGHND